MTHLTKRNGVYYFRRKVPLELRSLYQGKAEIIFSLKTKHRGEAEPRARKLGVEYDDEFAKARAQALEAIISTQATQFPSAPAAAVISSIWAEQTSMTEQTQAAELKVQWPAIIKLHGTNELIYLQDHAAWLSDSHLQAMHLTAGDILIDSDGLCFKAGFHIAQNRNGGFMATGKRLALQQVIQLVRMHAAQDGACCVAKLHASSIAEAIAMLQP